MREIETQSESRLKKALRDMAASEPQSAPAAIGEGLLVEFRRHHARRRIRRTAISGLVVCLVLAISLLSINRAPKPSSITHRPQTTSAVPEDQSTIQPKTSEAPKATVKATKKPPARPKDVSASNRASARAFIALPGYDPDVPMDELHVVRVQLPASALWKVGAPMSINASDQRMTADFVVSQDGTPYAVRLVQ